MPIPWDEAAFGDRLATVLTDQELAQAMGAAGRQRVLDRFTLDRQVRAYMAAYRGESVRHDGRDGSAAASAAVRPGV